MPHDSWRGAVAEIGEATGTATDNQRQLAAFAGIDLPQNLPRLVAAARIQAALSSELCMPSPGPCSDVQMEMISSLKAEAHVAPIPKDRGEASAWITFLFLKKRAHLLEELKLEAGDIVEITGSGSNDLREVSSIGSWGRIRFTGSGGRGAWPDMVVVRCRRSDDTDAARELKRKAANRVALRQRIGEWSTTKEQELRAYSVDARLTREDIWQLQDIIQKAKDEKPIQHFLEARPQMLTALLGGNTRFCLPRPSLGGRYVPDFFISDVNSLGIRWILVELETPKSNVTLKSGNDLGQHARRGVTQVKEWREWLLNNLDMARRSKRRDGLGLVDIRPRSEGLVLVGRRAQLLENADAVRNPIREGDDINVHTYDWLVEQLYGILRFDGPAGLSSYGFRSRSVVDQRPDGLDDIF
jgi:Shedu protein SduA, C-terminal